MWSDLSDFLNMGGQGFYVWSSYGLAAFLLLLEMLRLGRKSQRLRGQISNLAKVYGGDKAND